MSDYNYALSNPTPANRTVGYRVGADGSFTDGVSDSGNINVSEVDLGTSFKNTKGKFWNDGIQTEVPINGKYYVEQSDTHLQETGAKQLTFGRKVPGEQGGSLYAQSHKMLSWSASNWHLENDVDFLRTYGNEPDTKRFQQDFFFVGGQQGQPPSYKGNNEQIVQTYVVGRRFEMFCPHVMLKNPQYGRPSVQELDRIYIVMRRYPKLDKINEQITRRSGSKRSQMDQPDHTSRFMRSLSDLDEMSDDQSEMKGSKSKSIQYYWRLDPYVSRDHVRPPIEAYSYQGNNPDFMARDGTSWVGCYFYIGMVHKLNGDCSYREGLAGKAKEFLYPSEMNDNYKKAANSLPTVTVQIHI